MVKAMNKDHDEKITAMHTAGYYFDNERNSWIRHLFRKKDTGEHMYEIWTEELYNDAFNNMTLDELREAGVLDPRKESL